MWTPASDGSTPVRLQAVKSVVTVNNYCHNISNGQTQTAWKLLLSYYLTCEILWHSWRNGKSTEQLQQHTEDCSDSTAWHWLGFLDKIYWIHYFTHLFQKKSLLMSNFWINKTIFFFFSFFYEILWKSIPATITAQSLPSTRVLSYQRELLFLPLSSW